MKKIVLGLFVVCFLLTGCSKHSEKSTVKDLVNQLKNSTGYQLSGKLSVKCSQSKNVSQKSIVRIGLEIFVYSAPFGLPYPRKIS